MNNIEIEMVESFKTLTKNIVAFFENNLFKSANIGCSELNVLKTIHEGELENKKMNVTELANTLKITKSATSQLVSKLEKKGFVKRKINLLDKKVNYISLTEEAAKKIEDKHNEYKEVVYKVIKEMGEKDSSELSRLLEKLSGIISDLGKVDKVC